MNINWTLLLENLVKSQGPIIGILLFLILFLCSVVFYLLRSIMKTKEKEIERLAADNRAYREKYLLEIVKLSRDTYDKITPPADGLTSKKKTRQQPQKGNNYESE